MLVDNIINFLLFRNWSIENETEAFVNLLPPTDYIFEEKFVLNIPRSLDKHSTSKYIDNIINLISDIHDIKIDDLNVILKQENTIFKVRVYDNLTKDGSIALTRFDVIIDKIKLILSDTASFVIDKSVTSTRTPKETYRYLDLCYFRQTEVGSFVTNIQLPSIKIIKEANLFEREQIKAEEINNKLSDVLNFIKNEVFENEITVTDEYLMENDTLINIKLYKNIESLFVKAKIENIDFTFHNISNTSTIENNKITKFEIAKLNRFIEQVESFSFEVGSFSFNVYITSLKSKNPDGGYNMVTFSGINDGIEMTGTAILDSTSYKHAIEAHKYKQNIKLTGLAKRTKYKVKFIDIPSLEIE